MNQPIQLYAHKRSVCDAGTGGRVCLVEGERDQAEEMARRIAQSINAQDMLAAILDELDQLGLGDDETINGADAVDYLNELRRSISAFLKR